MADSSTNPYLALLQQEAGPPSWAQVLQHIGNLGFGLAGGFGQAAATGQPTMAAIGPGLMMGNQLNAQAAHQAEQERMKRLEWQFRAQEHEDKRAEVLRKQKALEAYTNSPGFNVAPQQPQLMGPSGTAQPAQPGADLRTGGAPLVDYLTTKHGLSPLAASTVVGNLYQESGFNPAATGDSGSAFGMAQWRLDRQTGLRTFAATQNKPATDPQVQLDYLVSEMKGGDMGAQRAYAGLQQAKTPQEANAAMMHFFRPAGYTPANPAGGHGFQNRVQYTQALLPNGQPAPQGGPQVAQGDAVATQPRPGPTLSALPAFQGPGMGAIQPGALPEGVLPSVNMPSPAVTPSGAPIDPNAPPPQFMQPGPNVVQAQYQPQPGQPSMAPGGGVDAPPTYVPPPVPRLDPQTEARINAGVAGGIITPEKGIELKRQIVEDQYKKVEEAAKAQHATALEVFKQQQESRRHERGLAEQKAARDAVIAEEQRKHTQSQQEEGEWLYVGGVRTWVPKAKRTEGMTSEDAPKDKYEVVTPQQAQMELGPAYSPTIAYQRNTTTRKIEPIRIGPDTQVNIDQKGETEFSKEMGKVDAKRFADIIQAEGTMNDMASKLGFALEQFKQTYTGPGAETANAFFKTLGSIGFEEAARKGNAADTAMAVISQMKPAMRAPGTGSSSDRDMDTFARALPSLLNLPDGNERITAYFQRMADRATRIRELAQEHSDGGKVPLTRTGFDKAVKDLGPLFTADEIKEMTALGKTKAGPKPPIETFGTPQQTPAPPGSLQPRPPIGSFGGG